jgi:alpha-tubulin suppressor-like RCC1 family protein
MLFACSSASLKALTLPGVSWSAVYEFTNGLYLDESGNVNTISPLSGSPSFVVGRNGASASAFQGSAGTILGRTSPLAGFNPLSNQLTLSAWIKTSSSGKEVIATMGRTPSSNEGEWIWGISSGRLYFWDYREGLGFVETSVSTTSVNSGQWRHVAFVRNELTGTFYVDGTPAGTVTAAKNVSYINSGLVIGGDYRDAKLHWTGQLDDFSVSSTALTPAQILLAAFPFSYTTGTGGVTITGYWGAGGRVEIPAKIEGVDVTTIGFQSFYGSSVTEVVIPENVTAIGEQAFAGSRSMTKITFPNSLTSIGKSAFLSCDALASISIPIGVTTIESNTFEQCINLASVALPSNLTRINFGAFFYCTKLTTISIPSEVTTIEGNTFFNCTTLASVYFLRNTPPTIGSNAFLNIASGANGYYPATATETAIPAWGSLTKIDDLTIVHPPATITLSTAPGSYTLLQGAVPFDDSLTVSGGGTFSGATIQIETGFASGDTLSLTPSTSFAGITGIYDGTKGILTLSGSGSASVYQAALQAVTFSTTSTSTAERGFKVTLGSAISFGGHYYEYVSGSYTWTQARAAALNKRFNGLSGYLANITSEDENSFVLTKISADVWIGGSDEETEGVWKWMDGPEAGITFWNGLSGGSAPSDRYANWNSGEPNQSGNEDYAQFFSGTGPGAGKWNDLSSGSSLGFLVEYGTDTSAIQTFSGTRTFSVKAPLISSGFSHTLYLGAGATTVTAWGLNTDGRLGVGDTASPVNWAKAVGGIPSRDTVTGLAAGGTHSLILAGGEVYAAGSDRFGQLGQGAVNGVNKTSFTPVAIPSSTPVAVTAGGNHSLIVTASGKVFACGDNTYGQLAQPATTLSSGTLVEVVFPGLITKIVSVVAGADHNLAVDEGGGVWVWGRNDSGQLGKNSRTSADRAPVRILSSGAKSLAAGYAHSLILKQDGSVLGFGRNTLGQAGQSSGTSYAKLPIPIPGLSGIRLISAGTDSSFAIDGAGQLRSWGYNAFGELLLGYASPSSSPAVYDPTPSPIATNVFNVSGGGYSSLAVGAQGVIFGGRNDVGQAGNGPDPDEVVGDYYYGAGNLALTNLTMDLAGTAETLYDQIFAGSGAVTLNGILNLMFVGTYTGPVYGSTQTFDLIWAKNGIVFGTGYQLAFNQAGYLVENAVADKIVEGVSGKVLQATVRAVVTAADLEKAADLAEPNLDGVEEVPYGVASSPGIRTLSVSPSPEAVRMEMVYSYQRPTGGVTIGSEYFVNGFTYRVEYTASLQLGLVDWNPAVVTGTTITPLGNGYERATLRISSSGGAGFLRLEVENPQATEINAGVGSATAN